MSDLPTEEELELKVHLVMKILASQNQEELGWIYSSTRHSVNYSGQPENNARIQARVDSAVGGVSIVYIFAFLEVHIQRALWQYASIELKERMYAYLHIRHTVAHGFNGSRVNRYKELFDNIMSSENPIKGIAHYDENTIVLEPNVWFGLKDLIPKFLTNILHKVFNNRSFHSLDGCYAAAC